MGTSRRLKWDFACDATNRDARGIGSAGHDGQLLPAPDGRGVGLLGVVPVDLPVREPAQHLVERDAALEPGQVAPEAEVEPVAEAQVVVDLAVDVEAVGIGELALVPVGRAR